MKIGHWKTTDVWYNHYIAARPGQDTTDQMLGTLQDVPNQSARRDASLKVNNSECQISEESDDISEDSYISDSQDVDSPISTKVNSMPNTSPSYSYSSSKSIYEGESLPSDDSHENSRVKTKKTIMYYSSDHHSTTPSEDSDSSDPDWE